MIIPEEVLNFTINKNFLVKDLVRQETPIVEILKGDQKKVFAKIWGNRLREAVEFHKNQELERCARNIVELLKISDENSFIACSFPGHKITIFFERLSKKIVVH